MDAVTIFGLSFVLGISSSLHCVGMCGPLFLAISMGDAQRSWWFTFQYFLGKTLSYASLGAIFGALGWGIYALEWQQGIAIASGIMLVVISLIPYFKKYRWGSVIQHKLTSYYGVVFNKQYLFKHFLLGFLNGLLPCGMVYIALSTAILSSSPLNGAIAMAVFGVGTIPVLLVLALLRSKINKIPKPKIKLITTLSTLLVGVIMILRGASLDIPFLSPDIDISSQQVKSCCH